MTESKLLGLQSDLRSGRSTTEQIMMLCFRWKLTLRGRTTYRHYRQPNLSTFLYSSNTTSWRLMRRDNNNNNVAILLVDYILRQSLVDEDRFTLKTANGRRHLTVTLTALAYADDVAIISDYASGAANTLRWLQFYSETIDLKLNASKTKVLHVGYESDPE